MLAVREQTAKQLPAPELIAHAAEEKAKAEAKNEEQVLLKTLIIEGVMDIQAGHSAKVIEQKLYAQIPPEKRKVSEE